MFGTALTGLDFLTVLFHSAFSQFTVHRACSQYKCGYSLSCGVPWACAQGANVTSIEPGEGVEVNGVCVFPGSGLLVAALEAPKMQAFFVPALGPAPTWCSFLENITVRQPVRWLPVIGHKFVTGLASGEGA